MIRILLVDDQILLCEVLKTWLEVEADFQVVGTADNGEKAIDLVGTLRPDILLIDIEMPGMDGLTATRKITQRYPDTKIIVLSAHDHDSYLLKSLRAGAKGYLLKSTTAEELANTIRNVYEGQGQVQLIQNNANANVAEIQAQIEEAIQAYEGKFQEFFDKARVEREEFSQIQEKLNRRFNEIEVNTDNNWKKVRGELSRLETEFSSTNRNFNERLTQQVGGIKNEIEQQFSSALQQWARERAALQEWAIKKDEMQPSLQELESKYKNDLIALLNPLRASVRDMDRQFKIMRNSLIVSMLTSAIALSFSGWVFASKMNVDNHTDKAENVR